MRRQMHRPFAVRADETRRRRTRGRLRRSVSRQRGNGRGLAAVDADVSGGVEENRPMAQKAADFPAAGVVLQEHEHLAFRIGAANLEGHDAAVSGVS